MSPKAQRIAIAEACGYAPDENHYGVKGEWDTRQWFALKRLGENAWKCDIRVPDYLTDLNAMYEAEKVLTVQQRIEYCREIGFIWTGRNDRALPNWWLIHEATAAHRAEAFLRTIGKWEKSA